MSLNFFHGLALYRIGLGLTYLFGSFHYHLGLNIIFSVNTEILFNYDNIYLKTNIKIINNFVHI